MKKIFSLLLITALLSSCAVQHFNVNTSNSGTGWKVFGENTHGKEFRRDYDFFFLGINVSECDTKKMAEEMKATAYTIETKDNLLSIIINWLTFTIVDFKTVKVIKR